MLTSLDGGFLHLGNAGAILALKEFTHMCKVASEQMDSIIACMTDPVNGKDGEVFDALELSPYDYCQNGGELEFINVIYKRDIEDKRAD